MRTLILVFVLALAGCGGGDDCEPLNGPAPPDYKPPPGQCDPNS